MSVAYWFWIGTIYLGILTYKDYKNNMNVDDRHNHFMLGISVSLISHIHHVIWYLLALSGLSMAIFYFINKTKALGEADAKTVSWIFLGFGIMNISYLIWWAGLFAIITFMYWFLKKNVFRIKQPTPFYIVLLFSFVLTSLLFGGYLA
jgi:Na+/H+ antiporter NhaC